MNLSPAAQDALASEIISLRADIELLETEKAASAAAMAVLFDALNRVLPANVVRRVVNDARRVRVRVLAEALQREILSGGGE